jgi:two-component sensor histidine kinase
MQGPDVMLPPDLALPLSLVVHELATNATKYGSLSNDDGVVSIRWTSVGRQLHLIWAETGGPPVTVPSRNGFGSVLIERAFPTIIKAQSRSDFRPGGLAFRAWLPGGRGTGNGVGWIRRVGALCSTKY